MEIIEKQIGKIAIIVLGNSNSGKSKTWNTLFGSTVRTGTRQRSLHLNQKEYIDVFLVSGSPEERETYVGKIIQRKPAIVLCSAQYCDEAKVTFNYFIDNGYSLYIQWLNPGYHDNNTSYFDSHGLANWLLAKNALISIRSGQEQPDNRAREIKDFLHGWAISRNLICN